MINLHSSAPSGAFLVAQRLKRLPPVQETWVRSLGRFPGEGNGSPLQYSCLENPMDGGAWCRLLSMGSQRVGHDWATSFSLSIPQYSYVIVQSLSHVQLFVTPWTAARQAYLSFTISRSLVKLMSIESWFHPTISTSVVPFSSCLQSFPASQCFQMSWLFTSDGQSTGASVSASVLPMNIQKWFPLGLRGLILQFKGLSRVFSNITLQKHQFFGVQPSLWSNSHTHTWLL